MIRQLPNERRDSERFTMAQDVKFKVYSRTAEETGSGSTVNMSSHGLLFTTTQMLLPGRRIDLSVEWPAELNAKCGLRLVARGRVVRYNQGQAAVEIQQYEFRTQSKGSTPRL